MATISTMLAKQSTTLTSRVPPPKSTTSSRRSSWGVARLWKRAAAEGSLMSRFTGSPASWAARRVAQRWLSLK